MKRVVLAAALVAASALTGQVSGVTLSLEPSSQDIGLGGTASVDLMISGMGASGAPSLGAFLTEITFDPAILSFDAIDYGPFLGDPGDFFQTEIFTTPGVGSVSLEEISFLDSLDLDALQSDSFSLATLSFAGTGVGESSLGLGTVDLSDAGFPANTLTADLVGASIKVVSDVAIVPVPAAGVLFVGGLGVLFAVGRLRKNETPRGNLLN